LPLLSRQVVFPNESVEHLVWPIEFVERVDSVSESASADVSLG
jgi:hypothetical protein